MTNPFQLFIYAIKIVNNGGIFYQHLYIVAINDGSYEAWNDDQSGVPKNMELNVRAHSITVCSFYYILFGHIWSFVSKISTLFNNFGPINICNHLNVV